MQQKKTYKVAGHMFEVAMEAEPELLSLMEGPYGPFEVEAGAALFRVTLCAHVERMVSLNPVYSNRGAAEPGQIELEVWRYSDGHCFEFTQPGSEVVNGRLHVSGDLKDARLALAGNGVHKWLTFNTAMNFCFLLATACHDTVLTHASCIRYNGKAYLFLGKSGTGKSTHSRMWLGAFDGAELMNDDHPVIRINADGEAVAYGSPWSGKTRCYKNLEAPVGGVVRISRAPYNRARRLSVIESYASLMTSCSGIVWEKELADGRDRTIQSIIRNTPCWVMECLPDEDAARVCCNAVTDL